MAIRSDYLEKLSCLRGNLIIVGDFNINWLDNNDTVKCSMVKSLVGQKPH